MKWMANQSGKINKYIMQIKFNGALKCADVVIIVRKICIYYGMRNLLRSSVYSQLTQLSVWKHISPK